MSNLLIYDIEVFKYDSLVVFKDEDDREVAHFWSKLPGDEYAEDWPNGFEGVENLIKGKTLVGFNNYNYDDVILYEMMRGRPQKHIKMINDRIIAGDDMSSERKLAVNAFNLLNVKTLDCMQQIDVSRPSLKKIEGNMGFSIVESDVSFDIDRPLTDDEKETVLEYCSYDVESTIAIYKLRKSSYFDTKDELIKLLGKEKAYRWNTTTISANLLLDNKESSWSKHRIPDCMWKSLQGIPADVWAMWDEADYQSRNDKRRTRTVTRFGCDVTFGFGGLHGSRKNEHRFTDVKLLDVSSMYPSIIILLSALGKGTEKYKALRDERLAIKHTDPIKSAALKLVLNSVYGNLKNQYSLLYNPLAATTVCIYGQVSLFDLCERLNRAGYKIININTDGVAFSGTANTKDEYKDIQAEWEKDYGLSLELDEFELWIQKDVNNYVAMQSGHIKTKGGECNKYSADNFFSNNDIRIVQIALVDYLIYGRSPLKTIMENLERPVLFQYVLRAGGTYKGVYDIDGNRMQNVNRVFAARKDSGVPVTRLYKVRHDGGRVNFPDAPEDMYVFNGNLNGFTNFRDVIDVQHYYDLVMKKLEGWK